MTARSIIDALREREQCVSVAESLTGGALACALVEIPGAAEVFLGGVVAYTIKVKQEVLGVSEDELSHGVVSREVAIAMARGGRELFGSDYAISTTGVAGPGPQNGLEPGTVWLGFASKTGSEAILLKLQGDRNQVRALAVIAALELVLTQEVFAGLHRQT